MKMIVRIFAQGCSHTLGSAPRKQFAQAGIPDSLGGYCKTPLIASTEQMLGHEIFDSRRP